MPNSVVRESLFPGDMRVKGQFAAISETCLWVEASRKQLARGDVKVTHYADDLVLGFESRQI